MQMFIICCLHTHTSQERNLESEIDTPGQLDSSFFTFYQITKKPVLKGCSAPKDNNIPFCMLKTVPLLYYHTKFGIGPFCFT